MFQGIENFRCLSKLLKFASCAKYVSCHVENVPAQIFMKSSADVKKVINELLIGVYCRANYTSCRIYLISTELKPKKVASKL